MKHWISTAVMCLALTSLASADFIAYNDCVLGTNNGVNGGDTNGANTTLILANGASVTGVLKDYATGILTTASVEVVNSGMNYNGSGAMANFTAGTDAANLFNGKVDMDGAVVYYGASAGWYGDLKFTGLNPARRYTIATTMDRGEGSPAPAGGYTNRWTVISINDVDASTYACSVAPVGDTSSLVKVSETAVSIQSMNTVKGYVAKWTDIRPGADGDFYVHFTHAANASEWGSTGQDGVKGYGPAGFMLQETSAVIISVTGVPGTPADWGTGTTWDLNPAIPGPDNEVLVRHSVNLAAATGPQTISLLTLDNANSDLRIAAGASLTSGPTAVQNGAMTVSGALNTPTLAVSGGSATLAAGSTAAITTLAVTGGTANVAGGSIGTLNASAGTTTLATNVNALNVSGSASVLGGAGGGAGTANLTGGTVDAQGNYLAIGNKITLNNGMSISVAGATVDVKGAAGNNIGDASKISHLRLNGGTVTVYKPGTGPEQVIWSESFETDGQGTRYNSNTNLADPAAVAVAADPGRWGRVTSVPAVSFFGNGSNPTEGSVMWMGEDTVSGSSTPVPGGRTTDGLERSAAWLDFNALSVAGKTGLRLTVDLMADGAGGRGPETNDEFKIRVKNVATGVTTDVEYLEGTNNNPYKSKISGIQLNTPNVAKSMSYDLGALNLTGDMQLTFAHSQNGSTGVEYIAFDNIKLYGKSIVATPIDLSATTLELTADSILDIDGAAVASFFDLVLASGVTTSKTLRIAGTDWGGVSGLASFFDISAPNQANIWQIGTNGSTYVDLMVTPEPATMGLLALGGLVLLRRRKK